MNAFFRCENFYHLVSYNVQGYSQSCKNDFSIILYKHLIHFTKILSKDLYREFLFLYHLFHVPVGPRIKLSMPNLIRANTRTAWLPVVYRIVFVCHWWISAKKIYLFFLLKIFIFLLYLIKLQWFKWNAFFLLFSHKNVEHLSVFT